LIAIIEETSKLEGRIRAPPSKSYTHRAIIASMLSGGVSRVVNPLICDDTEATLEACRLFGAQMVKENNQLLIIGAPSLRAPTLLNCGDSGSTIRFLTPIAALAEGKTILTGSEGLRRRPMGPLIDALRDLGVDCSSTDGYPPVTVKGGAIQGGRTTIRGDVSSQFISGLLFASPLAEEDVEIEVTTPLESKTYVQLTLKILNMHGIIIEASPDLRRFRIPAKQHYKAADHAVPGDCSSAAFIMAAATMPGSRVTIENLTSGQPDFEIVDILRKMGVRVDVERDEAHVEGGELKGIDVDVRDIPDLAPVVAALACRAEGTTRIVNAGRLRFKESDRIRSIADEIGKFGAKVFDEDDCLKILAPKFLNGAYTESHGDHRIAMACTIIGLSARGSTQIHGAECVAKSYPSFFEDLRALGGKLNVR
jgi:3-phosphoshikimate 1-carboxyvinyltransferase